jgi:tetratricopeptide (TPR) repeat protein
VAKPVARTKRRHHLLHLPAEIDLIKKGSVISAFLFLYLAKYNFLRATLPLLTLALLTIFFGCSKTSPKKAAEYTDYDRGRYYSYYEKYDTAFLAFTRYVNNPDDNFKKGSAYKYMGEILWKIGDLYGAQEYLANAIHTLDASDTAQWEELGTVYLDLGNVHQDLKLYTEALTFYDKATALFIDPDYRSETVNGKATALQKMGKYQEAMALYHSIDTSGVDDRKLVARIIDNGARTRWLYDPGYSPLPDMHRALQIRIDSNDNRGINASYAHYSDYYKLSQPDSALWYASKMREQAMVIQSPDDILEATDKLIRLSSAPATKDNWYESYKKLSDSVQLSRDTTRNRFALIRYDLQKSKTDNLVLQQHVSRQRLLLYGFIAIAAAIITWLTVWFRKRRRRIKSEAENTIRDASLKTSQKIHDVVANGLYVIMNELEHNKAIEREPLLNKIEGLYERSRNISYESIAPAATVDYDRQVHQLLNAFGSEQTRILIVGNQPPFWNSISTHQKQQLQLVLNELMINMKKHSQATNVVIIFKQEDGRAFITYKDDGIGFIPGLEFGNGLQNTVSRIKSMQGDINFGKSEKEGVSITISFPLESNTI